LRAGEGEYVLTLSWLLLAAGLTCIVLEMFLHDLQRLLRREPFTILFWGEFDARHPFYMFAVLDFFAPYVLLFVALIAATSFATLNLLGFIG
jgi:hypothetical protein